MLKRSEPFANSKAVQDLTGTGFELQTSCTQGFLLNRLPILNLQFVQIMYEKLPFIN